MNKRSRLHQENAYVGAPGGFTSIPRTTTAAAAAECRNTHGESSTVRDIDYPPVYFLPRSKGQALITVAEAADGAADTTGGVVLVGEAAAFGEGTFNPVSGVR